MEDFLADEAAGAGEDDFHDELSCRGVVVVVLNDYESSDFGSGYNVDGK